MMLDILSFPGTTNQVRLANSNILIANASYFTSANFSVKLAFLSCKPEVGGDTASRKQNFAIQYEKGTKRRVLLCSCSKDCRAKSTESVENFPSYGKDIVASLSNKGPNLGSNNEKPVILVNLLDKLKAVHMHILAMEKWNASQLKLCDRSYAMSAANLIHYLALKTLDIEQFKEDLSSVGFFNLENINPHVIASLSAAVQMLEKIGEVSTRGSSNVNLTINSMRKKTLLNTKQLLGPLSDDRTVYIMVTVGHEATENQTFITNLLKAGTNIIRINCAHGDQDTWREIIKSVKRSSQMLEKPCRILMDLAGPKLRTGKLKPGPSVIKISPKKDPSGNVIFPAQVWFCPKESIPPVSNATTIHVEGLSELKIGDEVRFSDARGKHRVVKISNVSGNGFMAECFKTAYVELGTHLYIKEGKKQRKLGVVVNVPAVEQSLRLKTGDLLVITRDSSNEKEPSDPTDGVHRITCSSGYLFDSVKAGESISFDDGKIWGTIQGTSVSEIVVSITHSSPNGTKLGSDKSINIPDSKIQFQGLTSKDIMDLDFVAAYADMVGISFVQDVEDIVVLRQEIEKRKISKLGIVLKIETKSGFENLPVLLLETMRCGNPLGVMIARGDLAVECGYERLGFIQEEILSICKAAHVPVIWATQVLESLVKSGMPTRAEISDVSSGRRANCIMINKGKFVIEAVETLDDILQNKSNKVKTEFKPLVLQTF
ncbi:plastidial pyruvate kinase 4, chloroplastic [Impatiens glandulifera]|uniref:plastidial pyruvate kinase 4, chloroplastic n=1 Tax=Impatiens glandulifera TaxID=253017 RepID=UPI001FB19C02|nr:plastidial pyruvate kinase 4, chloroplastic [Impatiens glandulifera]